MTLTIAVRFREGVLLAADSNGRAFDVVPVTDEKQVKIHRIAKDAYSAFAGENADFYKYDVAEWQERLGDSFDGKSGQYIAKAFSEFLREAKNKRDPSRANYPRLKVILCVREAESRIRIYTIRDLEDFNPALINRPFAAGGVSGIAEYLVNRYWKDEMSQEEAIALVEYAFSESMSQAGEIGGLLQLEVLRLDGGHVALPPRSLKAISTRNEDIAAKVRQSLYRE